MKTKENLTEGPLLSKIILFSLPLIATAILQLLFNTADTVVVGRWGGDTPEACKAALAGVGSCSALINLIVGMFFGLSVGSGVCVAQAIGARDEETVRKTVRTSVVAGFVIGVAVMVFGLSAARPLLTLMGTPENVMGEAYPYICAYFCGVPANMIYYYCAAILRSDGDTAHPLFFLSVAGVVNVILNLVMVVVFRFGAMGVGIATAVSQWISCILIVLHMVRLDDACKIVFKDLRVDWNQLKRIVLIGLPAGIQSSLFSFSNVLIQSSINSFGETLIAGNTAASNLCDYISSAQNAITHTVLTFVGQNVGARKIDRIKKSIWYCISIAGIVGLVVGAVVYLCGRPLLGLYAPDAPDVIEAGMIRLTILGLTYFIWGLMDVECGVLRAFEASTIAMINALIGTCAFRVLWIETVFAAYHTIEILYLSYPVSWILTGIAHLVVLLILFQKVKKQINNEG